MGSMGRHRRLGHSAWTLYLPCAGAALLLGGSGCAAHGQSRRPLDPPVAGQRETPQHRVRLYLKDGTYQIVLSYRVLGDVVLYRSAERDGAEEDLPLSLVDLGATKAWERAHRGDATPEQQQTPVLSPELAREEAARAASTPEVAKDLRLPEEDSVLALDMVQGVPELVPLPQQNSDLNRETAHSVVKKEINPQASPHDLLFLKDERADVQLHVPDPVFFVRLQGTAPTDDVRGGTFTVDTGGQSGRPTPEGSAPASRYVIERVDVRRGQRAISSLVLRWLGTGRSQPDVIETRLEPLPGGQWERLVPSQELTFGEYTLIEVLNDRTVNSGVWDFGVHPTAKDNDEAIRPETRRPVRLEPRVP